MKTVLIVPALNEAAAVGQLVRRVPRDAVAEVIVVENNNSTDTTAAVAREAGAASSASPGAATAPPASQASPRSRRIPGVAVFIDADGSQRPEEIPQVLAPILAGRADLALGARRLDGHHPLHASPELAWSRDSCLALACADHRLRPLARHPRRSATAPTHARPRVRLARGDGHQGSSARRPNRRGARVAFAPDRGAVEGLGDAPRHCSRRVRVSFRRAACGPRRIVNDGNNAGADTVVNGEDSRPGRRVVATVRRQLQELVGLVRPELRRHRDRCAGRCW